MNQSREHFAYLDGWRGLAIVGVLISHFLHGKGLDVLGMFGVALFFVLSGLLMARILFEQRQPLKVFYLRRASRILPVFWLYLAVTIPLSIWAGLQVTPADIFATPVFLRTYFSPDIWNAAPPLVHVWSLNVEEHAYLLLSVVTLFKWRRVGLFLLGLGALTLVVRYIEGRWASGNMFFLRSEIAAIAILLSCGYRLVKLPKVPSWTPVLALVAAFFCYLYPVHWLVSGALGPALLAFSVNHIGEAHQSVIRVLSWKPLTYMGIWSYSLYLWHVPFSLRAQDFGINVPLPVGIALAMAVGVSSYYFFELPVRTWINSLGARSTAPSGAVITSPRL